MVANSNFDGNLKNTYKKGFTLVELLAVIVVLAVIALIAIPVISNVVNDTKLKAFQTKIYALEKAAETYYEEVILVEDEEVFERGLDGTYTLTIDLSNKEQVEKLEIKTFNKGMLTITEDGEISITAIEDNFCGQKLHSSNVINMLNINEDFTCYLLNSSSSELGTQDILTAIQNLKSDVEDLKKENETLTESNNELKETVKSLSDNGIGSTAALNKIYPVGSIYISTTLSTASQVKEALGGEWEVYGNGRVLRGTTTTSEQTGGLSTVSLTTANLPAHSHSYTPAGSVSSTFTGTSATSSSTGSGYTLTYNTTSTNNDSTGNQSANHTHSIPALSGTAASNGAHTHSVTTVAKNLTNPITVSGTSIRWQSSAATANVTSGSLRSYNTSTSFEDVNIAIPALSGTAASNGAHTHSVTTTASTTGSNSANHTHKYTNKYVTAVSGVQAHTHTVTAKGTVSSTFTGTASSTGNTGGNTAFSVLDPYITVYMYKRVK